MVLWDIWSEGVDWIQVAVCCEHRSKPLGSIIAGEYLDQLRVILVSQDLCCVELKLETFVELCDAETVH